MSFVAFLLAASILAITPGPGITYVIARTVSGGRSAGLASCIGLSLGGMVHVVAAALGLSFLIAESAMLFSLVKYVGAAYLVYLGVRQLMRKDAPVAVESFASRGSRNALAEGILVEALNVKTALFFLAFLPQFVSPDRPVAPQMVMLGSLCVTLNTIADVAAALAAHRLLASDVARATRGRILNRVSGVTLLGLGTFLAFARREA